MGVRLLIVMLAAVLVSSAVDPDELLRSLRRVFPSSALAATVATRLIPVLARDSERLAEAQRCRPDGGQGGARAKLGILRAVVAGSLDRSLDVAATLEVRGYGSGGHPARLHRVLSRHDLHFALAALATIVAAVATRASGLASLQRVSTAASPRRRRRVPLRAADRSAGAGAVPRSARNRAMSVLEIERLTYRYPGAAAPALSDVSLTVEPGEFCLLAGLSASGKSTLVRAACGLVPHFHGGDFSGRVTAVGLDTREHGPAAIGALAGTVFQDPETQVVMGTVRAELALGLENLGRSPASIARAIEEVALALGLAPLLDRATHELSGVSCSASRSAPRSPGVRGWSCSTSPPRSSIRSPAMS